MLSIQDVGLEIMEKRPRKFYVFVGVEYGVKLKYIDLISQAHDGKIIKSKDVKSTLQLFQVKHFFPLPATTYVVRYDQDFLASLNDKTSKDIQNCKIHGTIVLLYESDKDAQKLDKYLGDCTVSIDQVNPIFIKNYLQADFPKLNEQLIESAVLASTDYNQARNICNCMMHAKPQHFYAMTNAEISKLFGYKRVSAEDEIRQAIARRSLPLFLRLLDVYTGSLDEIFYIFLNVALEMEKVLTSKFAESNLREYEKLWSLEDVYNLYMQTYSELQKSRSYTGYNVKDGLIQLGALLHFRKIPALTKEI